MHNDDGIHDNCVVLECFKVGVFLPKQLVKLKRLLDSVEHENVDFIF
jgi:hypothetical protein